MAKFFLKVAVQKANDKCEGHIKFVYGRRQESREASVICTSCGKIMHRRPGDSSLFKCKPILMRIIR